AAVRTRCTPLDALFFLLMADAGLRPGEACGVQWADFALGRRTVRIERAVTNSGRIKGTKTGTSREVDLTPRLVAALQNRRTALELEALVVRADGVSSPWVFARPGGHGATPSSPQRPYAASRLFDRLVVAADLPRFVLYDLRHSYASYLIAQRADPGYVARQMGHSSVATTLSFYAHWFPEDDRRIVEQHEQVRAAAVPRPLPAEDTSLPLDSDSAMAPLLAPLTGERPGTA
ncbi:MAG TPA: site-specific integrase, partial [Verrucomicrobiae bacterium]|nr:site-specific integrase [Verrucomicrobiae bacterium]